MIRLIMVVVGVAFIAGGVQDLYTYVTNRTMASYTYSDYVASMPGDKWLELTECELDVADAAYFEYEFSTDSDVSELFVPVYRAGTEGNDEIHVFFATQDPKLLSLYSTMSAIENEEEMIEFIIEHEEEFFEVRNINGMVLYGMTIDDDEVEQLPGLYENVNPDFVILKDGQEPGFAGAFKIPVGVVLLLIVGAMIFGGGSSTEEDSPEVIPEVDEE